ncbi:hypothetical protein [Pseudomonas sp. MWU12-2037]|uniref:hypothetical protein n=1 Tax=Pseudomonas sp. MWU12-2037 TaxID=2928690 RepID=UPI00200E67ED|nr:hypothetical protein [Pseudomonas sp. MWU12-2037]
MKNLDDFVDFEDGERHGWENDIGSPEGVLKTEDGPEGSNTFWSGKLQSRQPPDPFQASLAKIFTLPGEEQQSGILLTSFRYRVHPPEPGEATTIAVTVTGHISLGYGNFFIDEHTPQGMWLQSGPIKVPYYHSRAPVLIGTQGGSGPAVFRKLDIDDIKVVQFPNK